MNLEEWAHGVKIAGSRKSIVEIKLIIKEECLRRQKSF